MCYCGLFNSRKIRRNGRCKMSEPCRVITEEQYQEVLRYLEQKQKVIALIKDGRFVEALQELENETLA